MELMFRIFITRSVFLVAYEKDRGEGRGMRFCGCGVSLKHLQCARARWVPVTSQFSTASQVVDALTELL